jgi:hypothetical protein
MLDGLPAELRARVQGMLNVRDRAALYVALPRDCRDGLTAPSDERDLGKLFNAVRKGHLRTATISVRRFLRGRMPADDPTLHELCALLLDFPSAEVWSTQAPERLTDAQVLSLSLSDVEHLLVVDADTATSGVFDRIASVHPALRSARGLEYLRDTCLRWRPAMFDHGVAVGCFDLTGLREDLRYYPRPDSVACWLRHFPDLTVDELRELRSDVLGYLEFNSGDLIGRRLAAMVAT